MKPNRLIVTGLAVALGSELAVVHGYEEADDAYATVQQGPMPFVPAGEHVPHREPNPQEGREVVEYFASGVSSLTSFSVPSYQWPNAGRAHLIPSSPFEPIWRESDD